MFGSPSNLTNLMTKEEFQNIIKLFVDEKLHECKIFVVLKDGSTKLLNIEKIDLDELCTMYFTNLEQRCVNEEFSLINYSTADVRKDCYYIYDLAEVPESFKCFSPLPDHDDNLDLSKNTLQDIDALLVILYNGNEKIAIYKYLYAIEVVATKKKFLLMHNNQRFVRATEDLLRITPGIDVLYIDGKIFILNLKAVEKNDQMTQIIENEAISNIEHLQATGIVSNLADIKEMLKGNTPLSKKFIQSIKQSPVFIAGIANDKIIEFAKRKEKQIGKISYEEGDKTFKPKSIRELKTLLALLSDDLLKSELTDGEYLSSSKDPLK